MFENTFLAFGLTVLAGLSTLIGAFFVISFKNISTKFLAFGLGLSAGVMIYLSFFELLKESSQMLNPTSRFLDQMTIVMFLVGLALAGLIDLFTHKRMETCGNNNECGYSQEKDGPACVGQKKILLRTGFFTALIIALHNFPEGIATFTVASTNLVFGVSLAIAIAIHNIPEGFCIALPIYCATKNRFKSLFYTFVAGLAEPVGALLAYLFLAPFASDFVIGVVLAIVAGIMTYVALDELLPTARRFERWHVSLSGFIVGMIVISFSLYLLKIYV